MKVWMPSSGHQMSSKGNPNQPRPGRTPILKLEPFVEEYRIESGWNPGVMNRICEIETGQKYFNQIKTLLSFPAKKPFHHASQLCYNYWCLCTSKKKNLHLVYGLEITLSESLETSATVYLISSTYFALSYFP